MTTTMMEKAKSQSATSHRETRQIYTLLQSASRLSKHISRMATTLESVSDLTADHLQRLLRNGATNGRNGGHPWAEEGDDTTVESGEPYTPTNHIPD